MFDCTDLLEALGALLCLHVLGKRAQLLGEALQLVLPVRGERAVTGRCKGGGRVVKER